MAEFTLSATTESIPFFSHEEFRNGLPFGRFRVIMNPALAQRYVRHRLLFVVIALPLLAFGAALSIYGHLWVGVPLILLGFLLNRLVKANASRIMLFLATRHPEIYREAIQSEIMEVRLAQ